MSDTPQIVPASNPPRLWTSASGAARDEACPGAYLAQRPLPEPPTSEAATSGNKIHECLRFSGNTALLNALNATERDLFDSCRAIEKKVVSDWFGPDPPQMKVFREERKLVRFYLDPEKSPTVVEHSGQCDCFYLAGAKGLLIDYKTGQGDVSEASSNLQIRDLIALWRGSIMHEMKQPLVECAGVIIQPLATHTPEIVRYTEPEMDRAASEMMDRVRRSHNPKSPRIAGEHCKFCKAAYWGKCHEYQQWASATLPTFRDIISVSVDKWTPEQRTIFMDRYAIAAQWLEDTRKALEAGAALDKSFVPGYEMKDGVVQQPITGIPELINRIESYGGDAKGLLAEAGKITKEKLETYFKRLIRTKIKGSVAQNKAYEDLLKEITTPKPNKPTLKKI